VQGALTPVGLHTSGRACTNKKVDFDAKPWTERGKRIDCQCLKFCSCHEAAIDEWQVGFLNSRKPRGVHVGSHARRGVRAGSNLARSWGCGIHPDFPGGCCGGVMPDELMSCGCCNLGNAERKAGRSRAEPTWL
jgi:hypothetical protein